MSIVFNGIFPVVTRVATVAAGQVLSAGAVMGRITQAASMTASKSYLGTGEGDLTLDLVTPLLADARVGAYRVVCITEKSTEPAVDCVFRVYSPEGFILGEVEADGGEFASQLNFSMSESGANFDLGDTFTITVSRAAGSGQLKLCSSAATDGSAEPWAILVDDIDSSDGAVSALVYLSGQFDGDALAYGAGHTAASVRDALRAQNIYI